MVHSDDLEGPEDFTVNMEYWMKTPLPRLVKEPEVRIEEATEELDDVTPEGDRAISNVYDNEDQGKFNSRPPTMRASGDGEGQINLEESTMEHEEKVMSYLDALPDTDVADAIASTPHYKPGTLRRQRPLAPQSPLVQSTSPSPSPEVQTARSLQPTVEDSTDTPRKITQETMIHYQPDHERSATSEPIFRDIADWESRLRDQESAAQTRITELENILSFNRSELEASRIQSYKQSDEIKELTELNEMLEQSIKARSADTEGRLEAQQEDFEKKIQGLKAEHTRDTARQIAEQEDTWQMKLKEVVEKHTKIREEITHREGQLEEKFEAQLKTLGEEKEEMSKELLTRDQQITDLQQELGRSKNEASGDLAKAMEEQRTTFAAEKVVMNEKVTTLESRITKLMTDLKTATDDATRSRLEANDYATLRDTSNTQSAKIKDLEFRLQTLQTQFDSSRADISSKDQEIFRGIAVQERLETRYNDSQFRISDLEKTISTLRQDLTQSRAETDEARKEIQRAHEGTKVAREALQEARAESDIKTQQFEEKLKTLQMQKRDVERLLEDAQTERESLSKSHQAQLAEMRTKAEDAVRKVGVMLECERMAKKKAAKETKALKAELDELRAEAHDKKAGSPELASEAGDADGVYSTDAVNELDMLREIIRKQGVTNKAAKADAKAASQELESLRAEMEAQQKEFEVVNRDMNERFAALLKPLMKEKTKNAIENRDSKWQESFEKLQQERDLMGKVLMREWGKQECGRAKKGEAQAYRYHFPRKVGN
jgi:myosin protein heavy chain